MIKKTSLIILCSLMGAVFIFSGFTKLFPIEPFEYTFVNIGIVNWQIAPFIARILIGLEFLIGFLFLFNLFLRKITYKLSFAALIIFSVYLILLLFFSGNKGNCGCFGEYFQMTPLQALIKNAVMLAALYILYKYHEGWDPVKGRKIIIPLVFLTALILPFILYPVELDYSEAYLNKPTENFPIELDTLYANAKMAEPPKTLSKGKHIIAFLSLKCPHCKIAAKKMSIIHKRNPAISFYFVLNGKKTSLDPFFEETHSEEVPHCLLSGRPFVYLAGTSWPTIYLVNNSVVEHEINYMNMDQKEIEKWMEK